jgi:hypothetical protein
VVWEKRILRLLAHEFRTALSGRCYARGPLFSDPSRPGIRWWLSNNGWHASIQILTPYGCGQPGHDSAQHERRVDETDWLRVALVDL